MKPGQLSMSKKQYEKRFKINSLVKAETSNHITSVEGDKRKPVQLAPDVTLTQRHWKYPLKSKMDLKTRVNITLL